MKEFVADFVATREGFVARILAFSDLNQAVNTKQEILHVVKHRQANNEGKQLGKCGEAVGMEY